MDKAKGFLHIGIGIVYMVLSYVIIVAEKNNYISVGKTTSYVLSGLFLVYGLFRIYRGYKRASGKESGW